MAKDVLAGLRGQVRAGQTVSQPYEGGAGAGSGAGEPGSGSGSGGAGSGGAGRVGGGPGLGGPGDGGGGPGGCRGPGGAGGMVSVGALFRADSWVMGCLLLCGVAPIVLPVTNYC